MQISLNDLFELVTECAGTAMVSARDEPDVWEIGKCYMIRTVTNYTVGRLVQRTQHELVLEQASWIPDMGRFHQAVENGELSEVEPYPDQVIVGRLAIVDACVWTHPLPREQK